MPYIETPSYKDIEALKTNKNFRLLMNKGIEIRDQIENLEAQLTGIKEELEVELTVAEVEGNVDYNGWRVGVVHREGNTTVDRKKLLKLLGPKGPEILRQCLKKGKPSQYVQLTRPKAEEEEE